MLWGTESICHLFQFSCENKGSEISDQEPNLPDLTPRPTTNDIVLLLEELRNISARLHEYPMFANMKGNDPGRLVLNDFDAFLSRLQQMWVGILNILAIERDNWSFHKFQFQLVWAGARITSLWQASSQSCPNWHRRLEHWKDLLFHPCMTCSASTLACMSRQHWRMRTRMIVAELHSQISMPCCRNVRKFKCEHKFMQHW